MLSRIGLGSSQPEIKVTQYTSPDRQMSLPVASEHESTVPWLLSPKWSPSERVWSKKESIKQPKEALKDMLNLYVYLQSDFDYPSLRFEDNEPVINESYAETQHYVMKLQRLLDELEVLKVVSETEVAERTKLMGEIRRAIEQVDVWIEQEREKARKFEEKFQALLALEAAPKRRSGLFECVIA